MDYNCRLRERYPHLSGNDIEDIVGQAKEILINLLYKTHSKVTPEQKNQAYSRYEYWLYRCMKELVQRNGMENAISYTENGLSITFDSSHLSKSLINEILPIGVYK